MQSSNTVMKAVKFQYEVQASTGKESQPYLKLQLFFNIALTDFAKKLQNYCHRLVLTSWDGLVGAFYT